jgi:glycosyltransferase involved in cell wall biosynthesis
VAVAKRALALSGGTHTAKDPGATALGTSPRLAILLPCYNEEKTVAATVEAFARALPTAEIYVYDNNSHDRTRDLARNAGATVLSERYQGKGHVVRRMFADIDADIYVMADGDNTYHAQSATSLVETLVRERLDMVIGRRVHNGDPNAFRPGHRFGNRALSGLVRRIFGGDVRDVLSGYRAFSRRFVKSFPALSRGFDVEMELTVHALSMCVPIGDVDTPYAARPAGSTSKLSTYRDGLRIVRMMVRLLKDEKPLVFFSLISAVLVFVSVVLAVALWLGYQETEQASAVATAMLSAGAMLLAIASLACAFVLDTVARGRREVKRFQYLQIRMGGQER